MDNWVYWETLARQRQAERRQLGEKLRRAQLAREAHRWPGQSWLASILATIGVKLDAEAARTAVAQEQPPADIRRAA